MSTKKTIAILTNSRQATSSYCQLLEQEYHVIDIEEIKSNNHPEIIVVVGGDGTMLHAIHQYMNLDIPFYGINTGNLGFLMNKAHKNISSKSLQKNIDTATEVKLKLLEMTAIDIKNNQHKALAVNEVSLLRESHQASKISIEVNGQTQLNNLIGDGLIISTPAGSTAYNCSAGGPIIPITANLLAVTPINPFRPRRWQGALIQNTAEITIKIIDPKSRSVSVTADYHEVRDIKEISISLSHKTVSLLFNCDYDFEYKTLKEQFNEL